jgi:transglutaminase-like putative cysteine protease
MVKLLNCYIVRSIVPLFLILHSLFFLSISAANAEGEFSTVYEVTYEVQETGETLVTQNIALTNKTKDYYASEYTLIIGSPRVTNIAATDPNGALKTDVDIREDSTQIHVTFNTPVVGLDKTLNWMLKYKTLDTAVKSGLVWEVNIPRLSPQAEIEAYNVTLRVPTSFGPLMYISPQPVSQQEKQFGNLTMEQFVFSKEQIEIGGASAAFGEYQLFSFDLKYHLQNPKTLSGIATIVLPPDILGRQEIIFEKLEPAPVKIYTDDDGNYLTDYKLSSGQKLDVEFQGLARIFNQPINAAEGGGFAKIPADLIEKYTKQQLFWEVDHPQIQNQAKTIVDRRKTVAENAWAIYDFVSQRLTYNKDAGVSYADRGGAVAALNEPKNVVCMGFTDLFIALSRAAGIPARELDGYAYTSDNVLKPLSVEFRGNDVLHAWPEFYDPYFGWVAIDPTWGSTTNGLDYFSKLDTNHFVFAIKGLSSEEPLPAGAYKLDNETDGDVQVGFADLSALRSLGEGGPTQLEASFEIGDTNIAGLPLTGKIRIKNTGSRTAFDVRGLLEGLTRAPGQTLVIALGKENDIGDILPGQEKEFRVSLHAPRFNLRTDETLKLTLTYTNFDNEIQSSSFEHLVSVYPFFNLPLSPIHILVGLILVVVATLVVANHRRIKPVGLKPRNPTGWKSRS